MVAKRLREPFLKLDRTVISIHQLHKIFDKSSEISLEFEGQSQDTMRVNYIAIAGFSVSSLLHFFGFILLCRVRMTLVNQRLILTNLAAAELLCSLTQVIEHTRVLFGLHIEVSLGTEYCYIERFVTFLATIATKLLMIYLVLDRLFDIQLHLTYPMHFSKRRVIKILTAIWGISFAISISLDIVYECRSHTNTIMILFFALDLLILIIAIMTYSIFYFKIRAVTEAVRRQSVASNWNSVKKQRKFLVPFLMIATYIMFNTSGMAILVVYVQLGRHPSSILLEIAVCLIFMGWILDSIIYIFIQKDVRKMLKNLIC